MKKYRELAKFLPACVTTARRLRRHPAVPLRAKVAVAVALVYVMVPIDLVPDFIPVIGLLDDVLVVGAILRYAARQIPRSVLTEAWPAEPAVLERFLGRPRRDR